MHSTLAQAFPHIAAQIDAERVLLTRPIAEHTTCEWSEKEIILHCDDDATYQLLTTPSQSAYLRTAFSLPIHAMRHLPVDNDTPPIDPPVNTFPAVNDVTPVPETTPQRTRTMLTLPQRAQLLAWIEARLDRAATEPDNALAMSAAADLAFPIHASHVRSIRLSLSIAKAKPEPLPELSLTDLQKQVTILHIDTAGMKDTIAELRARLRDVLEHLNLPPLSQSGQ